MKILVDSDWVLELFVNREQYRTEAEKLLDLLKSQSQVEVYATELCLDKIKSFLGCDDMQLGQDAVSWVRQKFNNRLLPFDLDIRDFASNLAIKDFESAVEVAIAQKENMGAIITLNPEIFADANLPILSANNLIERLTIEKIWSKHNTPILLEGKLQIINSLNKLLQVNILNINKHKEDYKTTIESKNNSNQNQVQKLYIGTWMGTRSYSGTVISNPVQKLHIGTGTRMGTRSYSGTIISSRLP